jgi:hypothetical protein|tara:strand:- start:3814 stop:4122 length:309 start_codon:yes stop_codon:yes gene_type:complete
LVNRKTFLKSLLLPILAFFLPMPKIEEPSTTNRTEMKEFYSDMIDFGEPWFKVKENTTTMPIGNYVYAMDNNGVMWTYCSDVEKNLPMQVSYNYKRNKIVDG